MRATYRALPQWPYPPEPEQAIRFGYRQRGVDREDALALLDVELERIRGRDVVIGVVTDPANISLQGTLRRQSFYATGVEVTFETPGGRLSFHTNAFRQVNANLYAIAKGLEALRLLDRYGITQGGQQYEGWKALLAGDGKPDPERGRQLAEEAGGLRKAIARHHPDGGGKERDLADVLAYKQAIGA